jgi:hypothetical protein
MNHSAKKQHHEQARKKHKQQAMEHAREAARRGRSKLPIVFLAVGLAVIIAFVAVISFR